MTKREVVSSHDEQVRRWVLGESVHVNTRSCGEECCPDFSCCNPSLLQPEAVRLAFQKADREQREKLLMVFLGGLIAKEAPDVRAYITNGDPEVES